LANFLNMNENKKELKWDLVYWAGERDIWVRTKSGMHRAYWRSGGLVDKNSEWRDCIVDALADAKLHLEGFVK